MVDQSDNVMDWETTTKNHEEANFDQSDNDAIADNVTAWDSDMNEEDLCMIEGGEEMNEENFGTMDLRVRRTILRRMRERWLGRISLGIN